MKMILVLSILQISLGLKITRRDLLKVLVTSHFSVSAATGESEEYLKTSIAKIKEDYEVRFIRNDKKAGE